MACGSCKWKLCGARLLVFAAGAHGLAVCAASAPPPVAYAGFPETSAVRISPAGNRILMLRPVDGEPQPFVGDLTSGAGRTVFLFKANNTGQARQLLLGCEWATNDRIVCSYIRFPYMRADRDEAPSDGYPARGGRIVRLLAVDHDGGNLLPLVPPADEPPVITWDGRARRELRSYPLDEAEHRVVSYLPDDPAHLLVEMPREHLISYSVYRLNIHDNTLAKVTPYHDTVLFWSADRQGRVRIGVGLGDTADTKSRAHQRRKLLVADGRGGFNEVVDSALGSTWYPPRVLAFSSDGTSVFVEAYDDRSGRTAVWRANASTLAVEELVAVDAERDLAVVPVEGTQCGVVGFADRSTGSFTWLSDEFDRTINALNQALPGTIRAVPSMSADCSRIILLARGGDRTPSYYLHDRDTGETRLLGSHRRELDGRLGRTSRFAYRARDGVSINATLTLPRAGDATALPLVVMLPGGAFAPVADYDPWAEFLANRGYAVVIPEVRGSPGNGDDHQLSGFRSWGAKLRSDLADAVETLVKQGLADPERVCYLGRAHGAYMALVGAASGAESPAACAASFAFDSTDGTRFGFRRMRHDWLWRRWLDLPGEGFWADFWDEDLPVFAGLVPAKGSSSTIRAPSPAGDTPPFPVLTAGTRRTPMMTDAGSRAFRREVRSTGETSRMLPAGSRHEVEFLTRLEQFLDQTFPPRD